VNDLFSYDSVQGVGAMLATVLTVESVDECSGVLEVDEVVERIVADVLTPPLAVIVLIAAQQPQQPLQR